MSRENKIKGSEKSSLIAHTLESFDKHTVSLCKKLEKSIQHLKRKQVISIVKLYHREKDFNESQLGCFSWPCSFLLEL